MKDFLEHEIQVGDFFTSPERRGSMMRLRIGKVLGFKGQDDSSPRFQHRLLIRTVDSVFTNEPKLSRRNGIAECPGRMTVVRRDDVPQKYLDLLDPVTS